MLKSRFLGTGFILPNTLLVACDIPFCSLSKVPTTSLCPNDPRSNICWVAMASLDKYRGKLANLSSVGLWCLNSKTSSPNKLIGSSFHGC